MNSNDFIISTDFGTTKEVGSALSLDITINSGFIRPSSTSLIGTISTIQGTANSLLRSRVYDSLSGSWSADASKMLQVPVTVLVSGVPDYNYDAWVVLVVYRHDASTIKMDLLGEAFGGAPEITFRYDQTVTYSARVVPYQSPLD